MVSALCNPALDSLLARVAPEIIFCEVLLRRTDGGFELCHAADRNVTSLREVSANELRAIAQFTEQKQFRPLKSAPTLRRGWRCVARDAAELDAALRHLYPGAVADWFAAQQPRPPVTPYRDYTARQTGMYRITTMLTDEQAGQMARAGCHRRFCLKRRLWTVPGLPADDAAEKSLIPCLEPCAVLMEFARTVVRLEQEEAREGSAVVGQPPPAGTVLQAPPLAEHRAGAPGGLMTGEGASPTNNPAPAPVNNLDTLASELELLERQVQASPAGMRAADFSAADNPRRAQWRLEKLKSVQAAKGD